MRPFALRIARAVAAAGNLPGEAESERDQLRRDVFRRRVVITCLPIELVAFFIDADRKSGPSVSAERGGAIADQGLILRHDPVDAGVAPPLPRRSANGRFAYRHLSGELA